MPKKVPNLWGVKPLVEEEKITFRRPKKEVKRKPKENWYMIRTSECIERLYIVKAVGKEEAVRKFNSGRAELFDEDFESEIVEEVDLYAEP